MEKMKNSKRKNRKLCEIHRQSISLSGISKKPLDHSLSFLEEKDSSMELYSSEYSSVSSLLEKERQKSLLSSETLTEILYGGRENVSYRVSSKGKSNPRPSLSFSYMGAHFFLQRRAQKIVADDPELVVDPVQFFDESREEARIRVMKMIRRYVDLTKTIDDPKLKQAVSEAIQYFHSISDLF